MTFSILAMVNREPEFIVRQISPWNRWSNTTKWTSSAPSELSGDIGQHWSRIWSVIDGQFWLIMEIFSPLHRRNTSIVMIYYFITWHTIWIKRKISTRSSVGSLNRFVLEICVRNQTKTYWIQLQTDPWCSSSRFHWTAHASLVWCRCVSKCHKWCPRQR